MNYQPFICKSADDLIEGARNLQALGEIVDSLASHDTELLENQGGAIAFMVKDYAKMIYDCVNEHYAEIESLLNNESLPFLEFLKENKHRIKSGTMKLGDKMIAIEAILCEIDRFLGQDFDQIKELMNEFHDMAAETGRKLRHQYSGTDKANEAAAKAGDQATAPEPDQSRPEQQSNINIEEEKSI